MNRSACWGVEPHTRSTSSAVVLSGEVRLIFRSDMEVWLMSRPTTSTSEMVPMPPMVSVEVTVQRSQMVLGTSVDGADTSLAGVLVGEGVTVDVGVAQVAGCQLIFKPLTAVPNVLHAY